MFVRYFVELPLPAESVERVLLDSPERWVPGIARDVEERAHRLMAEVGFGPERRRLKRRVVIEFADPLRLPGRTVLPISWRAAAAESLFPSLEADLEVAALGRDRTQLSISARYRPPMGIIGRAADRALLHRVAEATVKDFLDRTGESIRALALSRT